MFVLDIFECLHGQHAHAGTTLVLVLVWTAGCDPDSVRNPGLNASLCRIGTEQSKAWGALALIRRLYHP